MSEIISVVAKNATVQKKKTDVQKMHIASKLILNQVGN